MFVFEEGGSLRHIEPVCLYRKEVNAVESLKKCRDLGEDDRLELDTFADMLLDSASRVPGCRLGEDTRSNS